MIIAAINVTFDPFWMHRGPWSSYWKPTPRQLTSRVTKGEVAARDAIDVALLGDSRVLWGLNPDHPRLKSLGSSYNFGMVGTSIEEASRVLDLLLDNPKRQLKLVIWVVQPEFVARDRLPRQNFDYHLSRLNPALDPGTRWFSSLWSRDATQQSWSLLWSTRTADPVARTGYSPVLRETPISQEEFTSYIQGQTCHFADKNLSNDSMEMEPELSRQFARCSKRGIRLDVVIPPSHACYWQFLEEHGWGPRVEAGKRCLTGIVAAANEAGVDSESTPYVHLWDFSMGDGPISEPLPGATTPIVMQWHNDAVHFKPALGDRLLDLVRSDPSASEEFGVELTVANLESHLAKPRAYHPRDLKRTPQIHRIADRIDSVKRR